MNRLAAAPHPPHLTRHRTMTDTGLRPRAYDLIVFDWDGTLYDSTALIVRCIQAAVTAAEASK